MHWKSALFAAAPEFAHRVAPLYAQMHWRWNAKHVPREDEILSSLRGLIERANDDGTDGSISSGGLRVWWEGTEAGISFECDHVCYDVRRVGDE